MPSRSLLRVALGVYAASALLPAHAHVQDLAISPKSCNTEEILVLDAQSSKCSCLPATSTDLDGAIRCPTPESNGHAICTPLGGTTVPDAETCTFFCDDGFSPIVLKGTPTCLPANDVAPQPAIVKSLHGGATFGFQSSHMNLHKRAVANAAPKAEERAGVPEKAGQNQEYYDDEDDEEDDEDDEEYDDDEEEAAPAAAAKGGKAAVPDAAAGAWARQRTSDAANAGTWDEEDDGAQDDEEEAVPAPKSNAKAHKAKPAAHAAAAAAGAASDSTTKGESVPVALHADDQVAAAKANKVQPAKGAAAVDEEEEEDEEEGDEEDDDEEYEDGDEEWDEDDEDWEDDEDDEPPPACPVGLKACFSAAAIDEGRYECVEEWEICDASGAGPDFTRPKKSGSSRKTKSPKASRPLQPRARFSRK